MGTNACLFASEMGDRQGVKYRNGWPTSCSVTPDMPLDDKGVRKIERRVMTGQEFERWRLAAAAVLEWLHQIDTDVQSILRAEGWPTDEVGLEIKLRQTREKPRQVQLAFQALIALQKLRGSLGPVDQSAPEAAKLALTLGVIAGHLGLELPRPRKRRNPKSR
jgi:hypothetical protein